jgi:uncharacterized protein YlzI (FlbEa/FlbD family)
MYGAVRQPGVQGIVKTSVREVNEKEKWIKKRINSMRAYRYHD